MIARAKKKMFKVSKPIIATVACNLEGDAGTLSSYLRVTLARRLFKCLRAGMCCVFIGLRTAEPL